MPDSRAEQVGAVRVMQQGGAQPLLGLLHGRTGENRAREPEGLGGTGGDDVRRCRADAVRPPTILACVLSSGRINARRSDAESLPSVRAVHARSRLAG